MGGGDERWGDEGGGGGEEGGLRLYNRGKHGVSQLSWCVIVVIIVRVYDEVYYNGKQYIRVLASTPKHRSLP